MPELPETTENNRFVKAPTIEARTEWRLEGGLEVEKGVFKQEVAIEKGAKEAKVKFILPGVNADNCVVQTDGWHSWSGWKADQFGTDVGMGGVIEKTNRETRIGIVPKDKEEVPSGEGRSYGWVNFRSNDGSVNLLLGTIPDGKYVQEIRFRQTQEGMEVEVVKRLDGPGIDTTGFEIFIAKSNGLGFADTLKNYGSILTERNTGVKPEKERAIWFSWAGHGPGIDQKKMEEEIGVMPGLGIDACIVDDGWTKPLKSPLHLAVVGGKTWGDWTIDTNKFPDMVGMFDKARENGIKPGIWMAPFAASRSSDVVAEHPDWVMKDKDGKDVKWGTNTLSDAVALDISIPEVREHIYGKMENLAVMGVDLFKLDYLSMAFLGEMKNKDETTVQYYRDFFKEIRVRMNEKIKDKGRKVEFMGCGASLAESLGLFETIRFTADSANPSMGPIIDTVTSLMGSSDEKMYEDATAVAARRILPWGEAFGLIFDGVHISDEVVKIGIDTKSKILNAVLRLKQIGVNINITIGDSLVRSGNEGRYTWRKVIRLLKKHDNI